MFYLVWRCWRWRAKGHQRLERALNKYIYIFKSIQEHNIRVFWRKPRGMPFEPIWRINDRVRAADMVWYLTKSLGVYTHHTRISVSSRSTFPKMSAQNTGCFSYIIVECIYLYVDIVPGVCLGMNIYSIYICISVWVWFQWVSYSAARVHNRKQRTPRAHVAFSRKPNVVRFSNNSIICRRDRARCGYAI